MSYRAFLLFFLLLSFSSGLSLDMPEKAARYETLTGKIQGSVEGALSSQQLTLYREQTAVPLEGGIQRLGDEVYVWLVSPGTPGTYTFRIDALETRKEGQLIRESLQHTLKIEDRKSVV